MATHKMTENCFSRPIISYCRSKVLQKAPGHSAILLTFIMLPFVIKIYVLSIFERPFYIVFTEYQILCGSSTGSGETVHLLSIQFLPNRTTK